nr:reverse transcriptase domain-containing protein [Tanacetum cinerariifolium]
MPPRMRTRSAGRPVAESQGGGTGERVGRGTRGRGSQCGCRRSTRLLENHCPTIVEPLTRHFSSGSMQDMSGCSIDQKLKYIAGSFEEEYCLSHEMQKLKTELWNHAMVGAGHVAYTDKFHELARLVPHLVTPESRKIERAGNDFATTANPVGRENTGA